MEKIIVTDCDGVLLNWEYAFCAWMSQRGYAEIEGGNMEYKIQACIACHGPNGDGNGPAATPVLSGQHAEYIYSQLKNFQSSMRSNDPNKMMRNIVHRMTDEEMKSVAQYIQGLH